jgi:hypothetical protein
VQVSAQDEASRGTSIVRAREKESTREREQDSQTGKQQSCRRRTERLSYGRETRRRITGGTTTWEGMAGFFHLGWNYTMLGPSR